MWFSVQRREREQVHRKKTKANTGWAKFILKQIPTWSHKPSSWSAAESLRSRAVMIPVTLLCYKPQVTVWLDKHSEQKSQVMATLEMAKFGPVTSVWKAARFNMAVSTSQQTGFNRLSAVETSKAPTRSASGVTWAGMDQWWWLVKEEVAAHVLITGLE